jgi:AraC-like DNA-binding protein
LVETDLALAAIASEVGYSTEFALSKAFRRVVGIAPGRFRRAAGRAIFTPTAVFRAAA